MNLEQLITSTNAKLQEVKTLALNKRPNLSAEDQLKLDAIVTKTENGVYQAIAKVKETISNNEGEEVADFLYKVEGKCQEVCNYTINKINEFKVVEQSEKFKAAEEDIDQNFNNFFESDDFKSAINTMKELGSQVYQSVNEYISRPETQAKIKNAKRTTLNLAEKGMVKLRELLKTDDE